MCPGRDVSRASPQQPSRRSQTSCPEARRRTPRFARRLDPQGSQPVAEGQVVSARSLSPTAGGRGERPRSPRVHFAQSRQPERSPEAIAAHATPKGRSGGCARSTTAGGPGGAAALPPCASRLTTSAGAEPRRGAAEAARDTVSALRRPVKSTTPASWAGPTISWRNPWNRCEHDMCLCSATVEQRHVSKVALLAPNPWPRHHSRPRVRPAHHEHRSGSAASAVGRRDELDAMS